MTEVLATSSVFVKEMNFSWKINDFSVMLSAKGGKSMDSPQFKIKDKYCYLRITDAIEDAIESPMEQYDIFGSFRGITKQEGWDPEKNILMRVAIVVDSGNSVIPMSGSLSIDMEGQKILGIIGEPPRKMVQASTTMFKNEEPVKIGDFNIPEDMFCINRDASNTEIRVQFHFPSPISNTISTEPEEDTGVATLIADLRALLNRSAENADFSIECGGKTFPCHTIILRVRSTVMDAMFQNEMAEASSRSLVLVDVEPNTMAAVLEYMYTGGITAEVDNMKELLYIADKYDMEGLLELCFQKLPQIGDDMIIDFLLMAHKHNFVEYKKQAMVRINMNKSKYMENQEFMEKLKELPHLLLELYKL